MRQNAQYLGGSPQGEDIIIALREIAAGKVNIKDEESEDQQEK
jgi:DNA-directed RNA polymerase subunit K/omega